jgi:hypothetical protein
MEIGSHLLEGNQQSLKTPLLILDHTSVSSTDLEIQGIVKKKIIFKTRPKLGGLKRNRAIAEIG